LFNPDHATWLGAALVQGAWAALLAWRAGLASWWLAIQLLFPPVLLLARQAADALACRRPPSWPSSCSCCCCTGRPSAPRCRTTRPGGASGSEVARQLPPDRPLRIIDIGSGLGGLVLDLARRRPDCEVSGIELAPLPWLASRLRALAWRGSRAASCAATTKASISAITTSCSPTCRRPPWGAVAQGRAPRCSRAACTSQLRIRHRGLRHSHRVRVRRLSPEPAATWPRCCSRSNC
jgi:hypothetical protein